MPDHMIVLTMEASGEVTPAPTTETEPAPTTDTTEAQPRDDEELTTDG